jgi:dTDP-4-dehydrorhamnose 3,5-epimerase-like enzyme
MYQETNRKIITTVQNLSRALKQQQQQQQWAMVTAMQGGVLFRRRKWRAKSSIYPA